MKGEIKTTGGLQQQQQHRETIRHHSRAKQRPKSTHPCTDVHTSAKLFAQRKFATLTTQNDTKRSTCHRPHPPQRPPSTPTTPLVKIKSIKQQTSKIITHNDD